MGTDLLEADRHPLSLCIEHSIEKMNRHLPSLRGEIKFSFLSDGKVKFTFHGMKNEINFVHNQNTGEIISKKKEKKSE